MADPRGYVRVAHSPFVRVFDRGSSTLRRSLTNDETTWLISLAAGSLILAAGSRVFESWWPLTGYVIPLVLAMNVLSISRLVILDLVLAGCFTVSVYDRQLTNRQHAAIVVVAVIAAIVMRNVQQRSGLGVASTRGESMLIDLRDRLASQSQLPVLPRSWYAEAVTRSAGGASFSGDFIVASKSLAGDRLEVAVVDVSGKGIGAGSRALLLSGAFGGLLGSLPKADFMPAANEYLLRQEWSEGFATAVHLAVDLETGDYEVRTAGHPPAVQFAAGSGRWTVHWTDGPVLGLIPGAHYTVHYGRLTTGDTLLLFTDGLVETPRRDLLFGIDKLLGEAEKLLQEGYEGGADRLVRSVDSRSDDRALLLLHRH